MKLIIVILGLLACSTSCINGILNSSGDGSGLPPGTIDSSFDTTTATNGAVNSIGALSDSRVIIVGSFTSYKGSAKSNVAMLIGSNASLDTSFGTSAGTPVFANDVSVQTDNKVLIAGAFGNYEGSGSPRTIRALASNGLNDGTFVTGAGPNNAVNKIIVQSDGNVLVAGQFTTLNGLSRNSIGRFNSSGGVDAGFTPGTGANGTATAMALQSDGKILLGGAFTTYDGNAVGRIVRINSSGSYDGTFTPGAGFNGAVDALTIQPDGKVIVSGTFTTYNGSGVPTLVRLNSDGSLDASFNAGTGPNNTVYAIAARSDGKVLIGGSFTSYNGSIINRIAQLNSAGGIDTGFDILSGANNTIYSIYIQSNKKILVGGSFTNYKGFPMGGLVRLWP